MKHPAMIVDTHAHLDLPEFEKDLDEVVDRALSAGVSRIITVGINLDSSRAAVALADKYAPVYAAVGVHPHDSDDFTDETLRGLEDLTRAAKVVAVGETGLDFYRLRSRPERQEAAFRSQRDLALSRGLPLIIHSRQAFPETMAILRERPAPLHGAFHCFPGGPSEGQEVMELGLRISLGGPLTYPSAAVTRELVSALPIEAFMLETDCPFLPPQGNRGRRNEPSWLPAVAEAMAAQKGLTTSDVARITTANARDIFGLDLPQSPGAVAYRIRRSLYLNITNRCPNRCSFCGRYNKFRVKGHELRLDNEPGVEEIMAAVASESDFDEVVFCGYGEPLLRLETVRAVAQNLKIRGLPIRINTNGLASLVLGISVPESLRGLVDAYSISLNAADAESYLKLCRPTVGPGAYKAVVEFIREAVNACGDVTVTAVDVPGADLDAVRRIAETMGARFRRRVYNEIG